MSKSRKHRDRPSPQPPSPAGAAAVQTMQRGDLTTILLWMFCAYLLIMPVAGIALDLGRPAGNKLTQDRLRFAVVNAITCTGFPAGASVSGYPLSGRWTVLVLTYFGAVFPMVVGGLAAVRVLGLPHSDRRMVIAALVGSASLIVAGAALLLEGSESVLDALMASTSAFANSGLYFGDLPRIWNWRVWAVMLPLSVVGGMGLPVLLDIWDAARGRGRLSAYSRTVLWMTAVMFMGGYALLLVARYLTAPLLPDDAAGWWKFLASTAGQSLNSRTAGFAFSWAQDWPRGMMWMAIPLMAIGANPAGTGGGLKTTTLVSLWRAGRSILRGESPPPAASAALAWTGIYAALAGLVFLLLLWTQPQHQADRLLFETISALSNVGLACDTIYAVTPALDVLTAAMLLGRVMPMLMWWWLATRSRGSDLLVA